MKTKLTLLATILTLSHLLGFGQAVSIKGKPMNYETNKEIIGAAVIPDSHKKGAIVGKSGMFEIKDTIKEIEIYFFGCYPVKIMNIPEDQGNIDFGEIKMLTDHILMGSWGPDLKIIAPDEETIERDKTLKESMLREYYLKVLGQTLKPTFDGKFFVYDFQKQAEIKP